MVQCASAGDSGAVKETSPKRDKRERASMAVEEEGLRVFQSVKIKIGK